MQSSPLPWSLLPHATGPLIQALHLAPMTAAEGTGMTPVGREAEAEEEGEEEAAAARDRHLRGKAHQADERLVTLERVRTGPTAI